MKIIHTKGPSHRPEIIVVELTRRNLNTLLAKLNGNPPGSACSIEMDGIRVTSVEDTAHYSNRLAGIMHPATEQAIFRDRFED